MQTPSQEITVKVFFALGASILFILGVISALMGDWPKAQILLLAAIYSRLIYKEK